VISFRLPVEEKQRLENIAREKGISLASYSKIIIKKSKKLIKS